MRKTALLLLVACGPQGTPSLTITAHPAAIDDRGQRATLHVTAVDAAGNPGKGAVKLTSFAGTFVEPQTITLDAAGTVDADFSCDALSDLSCHDRVRIVAEWQTGGQTIGADLRLSVGVKVMGGTTCRDEARQVFVIDQSGTLSTFDPPTKQFTDVGHLSCSTTAQPFSMSIARDAFAYVLYNDGALYRVSTRTLACTKTTFQSSTAFQRFGMGFSTNLPGADDEKLFIAGGSDPLSQAGSTLAELTTDTFSTTMRGTLAGWPELTGTGAAKLWGFFPQSGGTVEPFVAELDKTTGGLVQTFHEPALAGAPTAWAFAYWGGRFWVFLRRSGDLSTGVYELNETDGSMLSSMTAAGRTIVGAGTSTCTPTTQTP